MITKEDLKVGDLILTLNTYCNEIRIFRIEVITYINIHENEIITFNLYTSLPYIKFSIDYRVLSLLIKGCNNSRGTNGLINKKRAYTYFIL